jgi:hypothetical protein
MSLLICCWSRKRKVLAMWFWRFVSLVQQGYVNCLDNYDHTSRMTGRWNWNTLEQKWPQNHFCDSKFHTDFVRHCGEEKMFITSAAAWPHYDSNIKNTAIMNRTGCWSRDCWSLACAGSLSRCSLWGWEWYCCCWPTAILFTGLQQKKEHGFNIILVTKFQLR